MRLIKKGRLRVLIADEGKHIRAINDVYEPEHYDEDGELVPEHFPYYATTIYLGKQVKEEDIDKLYVEEPIE